MTIDERTKTTEEIQRGFGISRTAQELAEFHALKWVPREDYDSVLEQLIDHQKYLRFKVQEYGEDRFDLCTKIHEQAREIRKLKSQINNSKPIKEEKP